jgi:Leucine-rich repeat (LRR) protein
LYHLRELVTLTVGSTNIGGSFTDALGNLTSLRTIYVSMNQMVGSLPDSICKLTSLDQLSVQYNYFTGTLPSCMNELRNLTILFLQFNSFHGPISPLTQLPIDSIYAQQNFLTGSLVLSGTDMERVGYFNLAYNQLTGRLPFNSDSWMHIKVYEAYYNYLSGPLPGYHGQPTAVEELAYFLVSNNFLSGTIPATFFTNCSDYYSISMENNVLTGPFPEGLTSLEFLGQLVLASNFLSSTLPDLLHDLRRLAVLDLSSNDFTGTIPDDLFVELKYLTEAFFQMNAFTGEIQKFLHWNASRYERHTNSLIDLDISNNKFSGSLPPAFFENATSLQTFAATSNCITGRLPIELCQMQSLVSLSLDGLSTADNCRRPIFPGLSKYFNAFTVEHFLEGSVPTCLYQIKNLQLLHLSGNGLSGSIPDDLILAPTLNDLSLSHNELSGSIPRVIQTKAWVTLDLSYNRLTGTLENDFSSFPPDGYLSLEVNRLSGTVPSSLFNATNITILDGNIFSCNNRGTNLPQHDQDYNNYSCGSDSVNSVIVAWIVAVIVVPALLLFIIYRLFSRSRQLVLRQDSLAKREASIAAASRDSQLDDPRASSRQSNDSQLSHLTAENVALSMSLRQIPQTLQNWKSSLLMSPPSKINIPRLAIYFTEIRRAVQKITLYCLLILLPLYSALSMYDSSYQLKYAWTVSAMLLSGPTSAICLFLALFVFVVFIRHVMQRVTTMIDKKKPHPFKKNSSPSSSGRARSGSKAKRMSMVSNNLLEITAIYLLIFFVNLLIMGTSDFSYVYIVLNYNSYVVTISAFSLAIFRLFANNVLLWTALPLGRRIITRIHSSEAGGNRSRTGSDGSLGMMGDDPDDIDDIFAELYYLKYTARDLSFIENLTLLNNIIIPGIAIIFVLPDCFYNALFAASSVTSSYTYNSCYQYFVENSDEHDCSLKTQDLSYSPPFLYSYQCSSKIVINYVTVYILMFILVGVIIPFFKILAKIWYDFLEVYAITSRSSSSSAASMQDAQDLTASIANKGEAVVTQAQGPPSRALQVRRTLEMILPQNLRSLKAFRPTLTNHPAVRTTDLSGKEDSISVQSAEDLPTNRNSNNNDVKPAAPTAFQQFRGTIGRMSMAILTSTRSTISKGSGRSSGNPADATRPSTILFNKIKLNVQINSYLAILVSFGALFPPLAVIACFSICSFTYFEELCVGRLLYESRRRQYFWYEEQIEREAENVEKSTNLTLWSTLWVSCCLFAYIIFDTMGDAQGSGAALPLALILVLLPIVLLVLYRYGQWILENLRCCQSSADRSSSFVSFASFSFGANAVQLGPATTPIVDAVQKGEEPSNAVDEEEGPREDSTSVSNPIRSSFQVEKQ